MYEVDCFDSSTVQLVSQCKLPTKQLHNLKWGHLRLCNCNEWVCARRARVCVRVCVCVCACVHACVRVCVCVCVCTRACSMQCEVCRVCTISNIIVMQSYDVTSPNLHHPQSSRSSISFEIGSRSSTGNRSVEESICASIACTVLTRIFSGEVHYN